MVHWPLTHGIAQMRQALGYFVQHCGYILRNTDGNGYIKLPSIKHPDPDKWSGFVWHESNIEILHISVKSILTFYVAMTALPSVCSHLSMSPHTHIIVNHFPTPVASLKSSENTKSLQARFHCICEILYFPIVRGLLKWSIWE